MTAEARGTGRGQRAHHPAVGHPGAHGSRQGQPGGARGRRQLHRAPLCHGPMREDRGAARSAHRLARGSAPCSPDDIAVMAPDIEVYAPVIEAVFGRGQQQGRTIPRRRPHDREHPVVDALYACCRRAAGRLPRQHGARPAQPRLRAQPLRRRQRGARLAARAGSRRAARAGAPTPSIAPRSASPAAENTWRFGLDRMLLGYAMQGRRPHAVRRRPAVRRGRGQRRRAARQTRRAVRAAVPGSAGAGRAAVRCGAGASVWRRCSTSWSTPGRRPRPSTSWCAARSPRCRGGRGGRLRPRRRPAQLRAQLERALDDRLPARGLLARGVTFCQLVPMRSIPFKVVCLIGMNDGAFPGANPLLGFDRLAESPRAARRPHRRDDDRYMFLEALLCARERPRSPTPAAASTTTAAAALGAGERIARRGGRDVRAVGRGHARAVRRGAPAAVVQPALLRRLQRAAGELRADARPRGGDGGGTADDACSVHDGPAASPRGARAVRELVAYFKRPTQQLLQRRFRLYLGDDRDGVPAREPLRLGGLEEWRVRGTES